MWQSTVDSFNSSLSLLIRRLFELFMSFRDFQKLRRQAFSIQFWSINQQAPRGVSFNEHFSAYKCLWYEETRPCLMAHEVNDLNEKVPFKSHAFHNTKEARRGVEMQTNNKWYDVLLATTVFGLFVWSFSFRDYFSKTISSKAVGKWASSTRVRFRARCEWESH